MDMPLHLNPLTDRAKSMRANMTTAERRLWFDCLKKLPYSFRRQRPIGRFIVDFYAPELNLVIEVDGDTHDSDQAHAYDAERTIYLQARGLAVMRLTNEDVMQRLDGVHAQITNWISSPRTGGCHEVTGGKATLAQISFLGTATAFPSNKPNCTATAFPPCFASAPRAGGTNTPQGLSILILASGRGERFKASGGTTHKLDAPILIQQGLQSTTVLQATLDKARATGLPCHVERASHAGMGDSIAAAVAATQSADGWLILPADMPMVPTEVMLAVANALQSPSQPAIVAPFFAGKRGHPVGFSKVCLDDLLALTGDLGAKSLFSTFAMLKINVDDVPHAQGCLIDVDTMQDLEMLQKHGICG
jgi:molybdenum cofactor cytidylyltransferase